MPTHESLEALINNKTKLLTLNNLDELSKNYEQYYKIDEFLEISNNLY